MEKNQERKKKFNDEEKILNKLVDPPEMKRMEERGNEIQKRTKELKLKDDIYNLKTFKE